jgi:hypothetical protein
VHDSDAAEHAAHLASRAALAEGVHAFSGTATGSVPASRMFWNKAGLIS